MAANQVKTAWTSRNEQHVWISALTNRTAVNALCVENGRQSIHILCERIAEAYFNIPKGRLSTGFMPVYNPQDTSQWRELLGWLITVGTMTEVELGVSYEVFDLDADEPQGEFETLSEAQGCVRFNRLRAYSIWHGNNRVECCDPYDGDDDRVKQALGLPNASEAEDYR